MKLLIAGSRSIGSFDLEKHIPPNTELIISGGAEGIDTAAERYADEHGIAKVIVRPRYDVYGRAAPIRRNEEMVKMADAVLVIWDGISRGTKYTANYAKKQGKPVTVIEIKGE